MENSIQHNEGYAGGNDPENKLLDVEIIIIDLEEYFQADKPHPEYDHHQTVHYRVKINQDYFVVKHSHEKGEALLALVGMAPENSELFQIIREHGEKKEILIGPEDTVDLSKHHTEKFMTKEKEYCFHISKKEYHTSKEKLTVRQILVDFAKVSPDDKTLATKKTGGFHEYKNLDEEIPLNDCPHFTLFDNTPTGLS